MTYLCRACHKLHFDTHIDHILLIFFANISFRMAAILDFKMAEFGPDLACVANFCKMSTTL